MGQIDILGYRVSADGLAGDARRALAAISSGARGQVVNCLNPHSLVVARDDEDFQRALKTSFLLLPDGAGILLAGKVLSTPFRERVAGTEFFVELSRKLDKRGGARYFFLGSTPDVLGKIAARMAVDFPNIAVVGTYSPPFANKFSETVNDEIVRVINQSQPTVLWVGMTAPKQEKWLNRNRERLDVPLVGAIGAVFDFYAGTKQRAPAWICELGLEWLPRLIREPRRLWRRNFVSTPTFLWEVVKERRRRRSSAAKAQA